ncbi:MAG: hypothetical protein HY057_14370 [Rhodospirillales bacterium]|nr:hypothetical protein [Rhodospirillales bacterium]
MTDRPVLFQPEMVRALIGGRKTMTRRLAWRPDGRPTVWQRVRPGDRLWVRESYGRADDGSIVYLADTPDWSGNFKPSIHMPRGVSRLTLTVTAARIERLRFICAEDALAEGIAWNHRRLLTVIDNRRMAVAAFLDLWSRIHGPDSVRENPEVVAVSFAVARRNETGVPTKIHVGNAIRVWSFCQNRAGVSVADAARAFNIDPARVVEDVEDHGWMDLTGPRDDFEQLIINHDGE